MNVNKQGKNEKKINKIKIILNGDSFLLASAVSNFTSLQKHSTDKYKKELCTEIVLRILSAQMLLLLHQHLKCIKCHAYHLRFSNESACFTYF